MTKTQRSSVRNSRVPSSPIGRGGGGVVDVSAFPLHHCDGESGEFLGALAFVGPDR